MNLLLDSIVHLARSCYRFGNLDAIDRRREDSPRVAGAFACRVQAFVVEALEVFAAQRLVNFNRVSHLPDGLREARNQKERKTSNLNSSF